MVFETEPVGIALTPVVSGDAKRAALIQVLLENSWEVLPPCLVL